MVIILRNYIEERNDDVIIMNDNDIINIDYCLYKKFIVSLYIINKPRIVKDVVERNGCTNMLVMK